MPKKIRPSANLVAGKLAKIALVRLSAFSEEEQETRISAAERLISSASHVDTSRKASSKPRTRKIRAAVRVR